MARRSASSARQGSPAPSCSGSRPSTPTSRSRYATGDSQAGVRAADSTRASPPPTRTSSSRRSTSTRHAGLDLVFLGLPHEASMALAPAARRTRRLRRRPLRGVPAEGRLALPDAGTGSSTTSPSCSPRPCSACPSCTATSCEGARLVATPGCHVTAATLALAPLVDAGADRDRPASSSTPHHRRHRRRPQLRRTRSCSAPSTRTSPPTACSTTATRPRSSRRLGAQVLFTPAPRADEPRHPGHLLRPPGRRHRRARPTSLLDALRER